MKLDFLDVGRFQIALLTLNRPDVSNAFNAEMVSAMLGHIHEIARAPACRAVVVRGAGKNFCAGGDLTWMKESAQLPEHKNVEEARRFSSLFSGLYRLPVPTIAVVHGACFGGGVGVAAVCDWVIATDDAKFCLSEVKVGLGASIILPYVSQKIGMGQLHRFVLTARVFSSEEGTRAGLVQRVATKTELPAAIREEVGATLAGAPHAQKAFKELHHRFVEGPETEWSLMETRMAETIAKLRASEGGQKGLNAFLNKQSPDWVVSLPADWKLPEPS